MQLRYYQQEAVQSLFDFYAKPRPNGDNGLPIRKNPLICLPTGTGKSLVIGEFLRRAFGVVPNTRALMSTHVKTLISQNAGKLLEMWPTAPLGIYSAGLKSKDFVQPIVFGGVQSMAPRAEVFGRRDFLVIDEAHLVGDEGNYLKLINILMMLNPYLKVIGLSATPYRMGLGLLTNGSIFTDIIYDLCNIEGFNRLIAEGFLCPPIAKPTNVELDVSDVGMRNGEFIESELQRAVDKDDVTLAALRELVGYSEGRRSWLIFASGIEHAEHIGAMLNELFGIPTVVIHSKNADSVNDGYLAAWKAGHVRCAVSMNALTTGVDNPACDLIGMLRPTMSTGLWVQMLGRGTRPYHGKLNCLVLDFARNTKRLGPINDPVIPRPKGKGPAGDAPVRICENCNTYNHARAAHCIACGLEFPKNTNLTRNASNDPLLRSDLPQVEPFDVLRVVYDAHTSKAGFDQIKVMYHGKLQMFTEYVNFEHPKSFVVHKAHNWWRQRHQDEPPATNAEVLQRQHQLRIPSKINVWVNRPQPEILNYEF